MMKQKTLSFILLYVLVPLVIIPLLFAKPGSWLGLISIACYYAGVFIAQYRQWIFFPIPLFFAWWYWYTYGFNLSDYVTIYFFWLVCGIGICLLKRTYERYVHSVIPENEENLEYNDKLNEMEKRIAKYQKDHPGEKITQEIIEKIKTDVFFQ